MDLRKAIVSADVSGIAFTFYSAEEVRKMSVKALNNPVMFDTLGNPVEGGLYDPVMGPSDKSASCKTCSLVFAECPGHLAHIELIVPVYNPLLFKSLYKLLRAKCFTCHHFKISRERLERYRKKLALLQSDKPFLAFTAEQKWLRRQAKEARRLQELRKPGKSGEDERSAESEQEDSDDEEKISDSKDYWRPKSVHVSALIRETTNELMSDMCAIKKCENCAAHAVALRKDKNTKIFHSKSEKAKNDGKDDVAKDLGLISDSDKEDEDEDEGEDIAASANKKSKTGDGAAGSERDEEEGSEAADAKDKKKKKTKSKKADGKEAKKEEGEEGAAEEEAGEGGDKKAKKRGKTAKLTGADAKKFLSPLEAQMHMEKLWERELPFMSLIWSSIHTELGAAATKQPASPHMFFFRVVPVTPPRFRPLSDTQQEHPQTIHYSRILTLNATMATLGARREAAEDGAEEEQDEQTKAEKIASATLNAWLELQTAVNFLVDNKDAPIGVNIPAGVTQILEKKEGMFRKHMMGKRVNYAARSVISPDVLLETNQIGVPLYFAQTLTFAEPVTAFNYAELRDAVVRGPNKHPGANAIEDENGNKIILKGDDPQSRIALSKTLRVGGPSEQPKKVFRHLKDGDILLVNRQPTLHKPGIMGHIVKVLQHEKTIRMHYANCATYNADFDGDEMNLHFPQNQIARSEAYNIVLTDEQYVGPKNGQPLRGLIQDHIVTGALLTKRDTFFTKDIFQQLIYGSCLNLIGDRGVTIPPPAILKPRRLWTGKQTIGVLIGLILRDRVPLNLDSPAKIPEKMWGVGSEEGVALIRENELVLGVLDKNHFGASPFGLVHACFELYGAKIAGQVLTYLGRLFTHFLQIRGFTCGIDDMLLSAKAEQSRAENAKASFTAGATVAAEVTGKKEPADVRRELTKLIRNATELVRLDGAMRTVTSKIQSTVISGCIPDGQFKPFPANALSLMTVSGAKGSGVNHSQISCLLGQQELEGKRPAPMISGKTLPCFDAFDTSARAGGFIMDRFLTGLRPQEYFFHAMAGREGLIDTAVKTSRSGYLQRCLIKGLEGLRVAYDHTVRDADGSVVQFAYGGDHLDVSRTQFLMKFPFLAANFNAVMERHKPDEVFARTGELDPAAIEWAKRAAADPALDPVLSLFGPQNVGAVSEKFDKDLSEFIAANRQTLFNSKSASRISKEKFRILMYLKYQQSVAPPGDPVGLLAAQSIGEPSTQMTLNTFHQAGRGEANVTLGIPRMREVLMTAGDSIKTPIMTLPLRKGQTEPQARALMKRLYHLALPETYNQLTVKESLSGASRGDSQRYRIYTVFVGFKDNAAFESVDLTWDGLADAMNERFLPTLLTKVYKTLKSRPPKHSLIGVPESREMPRGGGGGGDGDEEAAEDGGEEKKSGPDEADGSLGAAYEKKREKATYDDADDEERELSTRKGSDLAGASESEGAGSDFQAEERRRPQSASSAADKRKLMDRFPIVSDYDLDRKTRTMHLQLRVAANAKKMLMLNIVQEHANKFVIRSVPRISRSFLRLKEKTADEWIITTEGVNFHGIWQFPDQIDLNRILTNDLSTVLRIYGVEAMRATLINEIQSVFATYGVTVDRRHLDLIGDYMTFEGKCRPFNRVGMNSSTSPLLKMSFETTMQFMQDACLRGDYDTMQSPAARIVLGQPVFGGTGCVDMLFPLVPPVPEATREVMAD